MPEDAGLMRLFLSGWLLGSLLGDGRMAMKITAVQASSDPPGFRVLFASGIRLIVKVEVDTAPTTPGEAP